VQFVISGSTEPRHDDAAGQVNAQAVKWVLTQLLHCHVPQLRIGGEGQHMLTGDASQRSQRCNDGSRMQGDRAARFQHLMAPSSR
jgi:hypothetical protein